MELSTEDTERIEQLAEAYGKASNSHDKYYKAKHHGYYAGAEYATIYERQQQAMPKPCSYCGGNGFTLGYENVHINCKHCQGTGEDSNECPSLPECYAASNKLDVLEAERGELRNKVIEECVERLTENKMHYVYMEGEDIATRVNELDQAIYSLNSLKTK